MMLHILQSILELPDIRTGSWRPLRQTAAYEPTLKSENVVTNNFLRNYIVGVSAKTVTQSK